MEAKHHLIEKENHLLYQKTIRFFWASMRKIFQGVKQNKSPNFVVKQVLRYF